VLDVREAEGGSDEAAMRVRASVVRRSEMFALLVARVQRDTAHESAPEDGRRRIVTAAEAAHRVPLRMRPGST
jgi:hypothetical protein